MCTSKTEASILTIDFGSSSIQYSLFSSKGRLIKSIKNRYQTKNEKTLSVKKILKSFEDGLFEVLKGCYGRKNIEYILLSTAMHNFYLSESQNDNPYMFFWYDSQYDLIEREDAEKYYEKTAVPLHSMTPYYKIMSLTEQIKGAYYHDMKSMLMVYLTGQYVTDLSSAAASGFLNIKTLFWDENLICNVSNKDIIFPNIVSVNQFYQIEKNVALKYQLNLNTKVMIGSTDGVLSQLAVGDDFYSLSLGTSSAVRTMSEVAMLDPYSRLFSYPLDKSTWISGAPLNNFGNVLSRLAGEEVFPEFFHRVLAIHHDILSGKDEKVPVVLPFLYGSRSPFWRSDLNYKIQDSKGYNKYQIGYGTLLSMLINISLSYEILNKGLDYQKPIVLNGGLASHSEIQSILSYYMNIPCFYRVENELLIEKALLSLADFSSDLALSTQNITMTKALEAFLNDYRKQYIAFLKEEKIFF